RRLSRGRAPAAPDGRGGSDYLRAVTGRERLAKTLWRTAPLVLLLSAAALPVAWLAARFIAEPTIDASSLTQTLAFALLGATIATVVGGAVGSLAGTLEIPGRWWLLSLSVVLLAAPPAFWWIGFTRAPLGMPGVSGLIAGSTLSGMMLAPIPLLL